MDKAIAGGLNVTDQSKLHVQWYQNGCVVFYDANDLSLTLLPQIILGDRLVPASCKRQRRNQQGLTSAFHLSRDPAHIPQGALVHFSEEQANNDTAPSEQEGLLISKSS